MISRENTKAALTLFDSYLSGDIGDLELIQHVLADVTQRKIEVPHRIFAFAVTNVIRVDAWHVQLLEENLALTQGELSQVKGQVAASEHRLDANEHELRTLKSKLDHLGGCQKRQGAMLTQQRTKLTIQGAKLTIMGRNETAIIDVVEGLTARALEER